jgi:hypothetical protein
MSEEEWLECTDIGRMLEFIHDKGTDRQWRLYLCGGCRAISHLFYSNSSRRAVDVAEEFTEGLADEAELDRAEWSAEVPTFGHDFYPSGISRSENLARLIEMGAIPESARHGTEWVANEGIQERLIAAANLAEACAFVSLRPSEFKLRYMRQVDWPGRWLIECVFGNPFRPVKFNQSWLTSNVVGVAQRIYDERQFQDMHILGDALEDAGCGKASILEHCRSGGEHVRGCWVVDLILGKQ